VGADIYGWVEIRRPDSEWWDAAICIDDIVQRQYGMFASLFGVRNWVGVRDVVPEKERTLEHGCFRAIAPGRGEPQRASEYYRSERGDREDVVGETWVLWSELAVVNWDEEGEDYIDEEGLRCGEPGPGRRHERRADYLTGGWATLLKLMEILAGQFGAENVRLAVWFDQW
jgi:hypothetical protein